jgi:predicted nucleic acid-binding protein
LVFPEEGISAEIYKQANYLCYEIDPDDTAFIALALHVKGFLWSGDKRLRNGVNNKGEKLALSTDELIFLT